MSNQSTIRVFISSPNDVRPERLKAEQIVARLDREFSYHFHVEAVLWEREPLVATLHFQDYNNIPAPHGMDVVVVILWSRLGVPLPADRFRGAVSGRCPVTGTEWEFEDALAGARERGVPDLLLYRKTASHTADLGDRQALTEQLAQLDLVKDFFARWIGSAEDQSLTAASHSFADTSAFEGQLYEHLRTLLARRAGNSAAGVAVRWHDSPYRALLSYEYEHAPVFFGRTQARNELRELLTRRIADGTAFVLLLGASGSGKSSLAKAGLLPDLALPGMITRVGLVRRGVMRPSDTGVEPLASLAAVIMSKTALPELAALQYSPERLTTLLREAPGHAALAIRQGLTEAGKAAGLTDIAQARLAIVVDQLEEISTIPGLGQRDRESFVTALETLSKSGLVWLVATIRSDFFDRLETIPTLAALSAEGRFLLLPPNEAEIGQIIRQPAQEAGLRFQHDGTHGISLDEAILRDAIRDRDALPLLSFLLDQLWQKRSETGFLTFDAYRELGELAGAIGKRAEEVFQAQPERAQAELVTLLRALVTVRGTTATSRAALLSEFEEGSPLRALVEAFLHPHARLLVGDSESGNPQIRLAHEALLTHWDRARIQVAADVRDLELRGRLEEEAKLWRNAPPKEKKARVRSGLLLAEARALLSRWRLPQDVTEFIAASRRAEWWRRVRLWGLVAAGPPVVALFAAVIWAGLIWSGVRQVEAEIIAKEKFALIQEGDVDMGKLNPPASTLRPNAEGGQKVHIKAFYLGKYEVTQSEWQRVMVFLNPNPSSSYFRDEQYRQQYGSSDQLPVNQVTWNEAKRFLWLMSVFGHYEYRLPTEAEWEYAARAGTTWPYFWDDPREICQYANAKDRSFKQHETEDIDTDFADCDDGYWGVAPVESYKDNKFKLHNMLGNVAEWVEDCYVANYDDTFPLDGSPRTTVPCANHVVRGGAWNSGTKALYVTVRGVNDATDSKDYLGFRMARSITREAAGSDVAH